jgi:hypothetical protein
MSDTAKLLKEVHEALEDHGEDPRAPMMRALSSLIAEYDSPQSGDILLTATLSPGGKYKVTDQNGRSVAGVRSVAVFEDPRGQPVFQVNL